MTSHELNTEIEICGCSRSISKSIGAVWALPATSSAIALCIAVLIRTAVTGGTPPPLMIFIVLTYVFLGLAFTTAGRSRGTFCGCRTGATGASAKEFSAAPASAGA